VNRADRLAEALRLLRQTRGRSQRAAAAAIGVGASAVGSWEQGRRRPTIDQLGRLADLLALDLGDLDDALELAGASPGRRLRPAAAGDLSPGRLARQILGRSGDDAPDPVESELAGMLRGLLRLAERLRAGPCQR